MTVAQREIKSHEYKIMLKASKFKDVDQRELHKPANRFWKKLGRKLAVAGGGAAINKRFKKPKGRKGRKVRFYDTTDRLLDANDYVFRVRGKGETWQKTLKFRQRGSLEVARKTGMDPAGAPCNDDPKCKLEVDVKLEKAGNSPWTEAPKVRVSLYSSSTTKNIGSGKGIKTMAEPGEFVPGLQAALGNSYNADARITSVGDFTARERVIEGGELVMDANPDVEIECGVVVWYDDSKDQRKPEVAEFSFKYKEEDSYPGLDQVCEDVLKIVADMGWVDPNQVTKTRFVYNKD
jgi:hypothetical protein